MGLKISHTNSFVMSFLKKWVKRWHKYKASGWIAKKDFNVFLILCRALIKANVEDPNSKETNFRSILLRGSSFQIAVWIYKSIITKTSSNINRFKAS